MDNAHDDASRLRIAQKSLDQAATRQNNYGGGGAPAFVGKIVTTSGTAAPSVFTVQPQNVLGTQTEGATGSLSTAGSNVLATNLGSQIPAAGTPVLCHWVDYRWVFRYF